MTTGQHINLIRNRRNMTLGQLAIISGVSKNTLIGWIYHNVSPNLEPLMKVANALNISLDELVGREWSANTVPQSEVDILKSLITCKEEEAYRKGYEDETVDNGTPRHEGYWLKTDAYPHRVYCSECYKTYVTNEEIIHGRSSHGYCYCTEAEFCPHCGAKMKGGAE